MKDSAAPSFFSACKSKAESRYCVTVMTLGFLCRLQCTFDSDLGATSDVYHVQRLQQEAEHATPIDRICNADFN